MKVKALLLTLIAATFSLANASANDGSLFSYDRAAVNAQMSDLNKVESYVTTHEGVTLDQLKSQNSDVVANINFNTSSASFSNLAEGPLGIPSFIWGCVLSWVGILIVYLVTQDSEETKKALYGCLVWVGIWLIWILIWVVLVGNSFLFFG